MVQKINIPAPVSAVSLTPLARVVRTLIQVLISIGAAIPVILNTPGVVGNAVIAKDLGIVAGFIATVTTLWNSLEHFGVIPVVGGKAVTSEVRSAVIPPHMGPTNVPSL